ncbi:MAG: D-glycero-beta-D-manno-heptose-7-phosphate kinase [Candidatus Kapaibacterium sp.]|jgi:rfaE bifunctional protein kinase chain/domain
MLNLSPDQLEALPKAFRSSRIAVIGDLMLDRYQFGTVSRISPEAPVPVLEIEREQDRLGGAANVGHNIHGLGATPIMFGVVGNDASGELLRSLFAAMHFPLEGILTDPERRTTVKTRLVAGSQQMLRIDHESKTNISARIEDTMLRMLEGMSNDLHGIILEDYNKGVITASLIRRVIGFGKSHNIPVLVDPKFQNFFEYKGATVFKPNRKEVEDALGTHLHSPVEIADAGQKLLDGLSAENVLLTLGEKGMLLFERGERESFGIPTRARQVADVSGAGDTVIATLAVCMACGLSVRESAVMANRAAGLVIEELGIVPIYQEQLMAALLEDIATEAA